MLDSSQATSSQEGTAPSPQQWWGTYGTCAVAVCYHSKLKGLLPLPYCVVKLGGVRVVNAFFISNRISLLAVWPICNQAACASPNWSEAPQG